MRLGVTLPQAGRLASADALVRAAREAEGLGYHSVWTFDRILAPVSPRTPYPASPDGKLPESARIVLDPLETLTYVAAHTSRVTLGTSVLNLPFYNPVVLARRLTTLDVLSGGRLRVGFGQGWSEDEFEAVGADPRERGARADEFLAALQAIWTTDPVEFQGRHYRIARSWIGPKPVQRPRPPIYLAAYVPPALRRAARVADGWLPAGLPPEALARMIPAVRQMVKEAGRDPARFEVIHLGGPGPDGPEAARDFLARLRDLGVDEVIAMPDADTLDRQLAAMARLREAAQRLG